MIAAEVSGLDLALAEDGSAELASPHDERVFQQPPFLQIRQQRRRRLVGIVALARDAAPNVGVLIPPPMVELDEPHIPLREATRQYAVRRERTWFARLGAVAIKCRVGLPAQVRQLRHGALHPERKFVLGNPALHGGISVYLPTFSVEDPEIIQHRTTVGRTDTVGVAQIKHRVPPRRKAYALMFRGQKPAAPHALV